MASIKGNIRWLAGACALLAVLVSATPAHAEAPWWRLSASARPANLPPGGEGTVVMQAVNVGDAGTTEPVTLTDTLPAGIEAQSVSFRSGTFSAGGYNIDENGEACEVTAGRVICNYSEATSFLQPLRSIPPFRALEMRIAVKVRGDAASGTGRLEVTGGGAPVATGEEPLTVSGSPPPFGAEAFSFTPEEDGGAVDARAGSHPFQITSTLALKQTADPASPPALPRDLRFQLPAGLVGDAAALPHCSEADFGHLSRFGYADLCPEDTAIGVTTVTVDEPVALTGLQPRSVPVFNLTPGPGEPARFGFDVLKGFVVMDTSVRVGRDYGVTVSVNNITQIANTLITNVTLWGVPGDPRHNAERGWQCLLNGFWVEEEEPCVTSGPSQPPALLTLPGVCEGPLTTMVEGDSWPTRANPAGFAFAPIQTQPTDGLGHAVGMTGCEQLPFSPSLSLTPETRAASTPTGVDVHVHLPQDTTLSAGTPAEAAIKSTTVALPAGMSLNPAGAGGLQACSETQVGFQGIGAGGAPLFTPELASPFCADASKVATVTVRLPIIANPLQGAVYLAAQNENPFGSLVALYIVAEDPVSGIRVKLPGEVALDPQTGQVVTTFHNIPQAPVEDLELHFFGGPRGPLATPAACGTYTTQASFTSWASATPVNVSAPFTISSGPGGGACQSPRQFAPSFVAGTASAQAGGFSPFTATFSRGDADQGLQGVTVTMPPGLLGIIKGIERCPEPQAGQGACGAGSLLGHATALAGAGPEPFSVQGGQVFLTGPYKGAPFGLSIVVPAVAGPFNLGNVVVRAAIEVDPHTAQIKVVSDPLPTILQGIPLQIRRVTVAVDRPGFTFNPTSCAPLAVTGGLTGSEGASAAVSSSFTAVNCARLPFKPTFKVSTQAQTSKKNGASLDVKVTSGQGQANLGKVAVTLPKALPSRLTTIQQACPEATFNANPASCPAGSNIGTATARTPVITSLFTGPAYLVSHGGAAFPDLVIILQGEGVTLDLIGSINIKKSITSSTFASVPDAPISSFELKLPEGPHSGLAAVLPAKAKGSLCGTSLTMPTTLTGQNGAQIKQNTKITVTGCPKTRKAHKPKHKQRKKK